MSKKLFLVGLNKQGIHLILALLEVPYPAFKQFPTTLYQLYPAILYIIIHTYHDSSGLPNRFCTLRFLIS